MMMMMIFLRLTLKIFRFFFLSYFNFYVLSRLFCFIFFFFTTLLIQLVSYEKKHKKSINKREIRNICLFIWLKVKQKSELYAFICGFGEIERERIACFLPNTFLCSRSCSINRILYFYAYMNFSVVKKETFQND
jgi:hypothetical protein